MRIPNPRDLMPMCNLRSSWILLILLILWGPFPANSEPGATAQVQAATATRTGFSVVPTGTPEADQAVSDVINCFLQRELTKDAAVQIALLNNRELQAWLSELGIAYGDLVEGGILSNPVLEFAYRRSSEPGTVVGLEFNLVQDFVNLITLPLRRKVAASDFEKVKLEIASEVLELAFDSQVAYYELQAALESGTLYKQAVEAAELSYEAARMIHEAGNISDLVLHQEQALYEEQKLQLAETEVEAVELRERLNLLMGLWGPCTEWRIVPHLPKLPTKEVAPQGLESVAVCQRFDLAASRQEIETIARELGITNLTAVLPKLEAGLTTERETDGSWLRGGTVSLPIPIFNQGQGRITRLRAQLCRAQHRYYAKAVEIRSEVRSARTRMMRARERVRYYEKVMLPLRARMVKESHLMFNAMEVSPFELFEAKRDEVKAKQEQVTAQRAYWVARSELERALGGSLRCMAIPEPQSPGRPRSASSVTAAGVGAHSGAAPKSSGSGEAGGAVKFTGRTGATSGSAGSSGSASVAGGAS